MFGFSLSSSIIYNIIALIVWSIVARIKWKRNKTRDSWFVFALMCVGGHITMLLFFFTVLTYDPRGPDEDIFIPTNDFSSYQLTSEFQLYGCK